MEVLNIMIVSTGLINLGLILFLVLKSRVQTASNLEGIIKESQSSVQQEVRNESYRLGKVYRDEIALLRQEMGKSSAELRAEVATQIHSFKDSITKSQGELGTMQKGQLDSFSSLIQQMARNNDERQAQLRESVEKRLVDLQQSNDKKIEEMRVTVDEKLHGTLEKRLGESFKQVSERLEMVREGLGEMKTLAAGVGDLKKVLTNVKSRGTWGEIQLGALLEDMLTPDQYDRNVQIRSKNKETVEFAIRLPGNTEETPQVWLPLDSKFPKEDYERLLQAQDQGDPEAAETSRAALEASIDKCAKDIRDKYIHPPYSVDFGILFLPVESLYAEVLRRPGLMDKIQQKYRVTIAGPTTLCALLNSLQMGFRTLAIQKRSSEVWEVLGAVKSEFQKFGGILDKAQKQLSTVQKTLGEASTKTKTIGRKLQGVESIGMDETAPLLQVEAPEETPPDGETLSLDFSEDANQE